MCKSLGGNMYECSGACNSSGSVWGSGVYTSDSNIFVAARHAKLVPGAFFKIDLPGQPSYIGSTCNGVTTASYGSYGSSFVLGKVGSQLNLQINSVNEFQAKIQSLRNIETSLVNLLSTHQKRLDETVEKSAQKQKLLATIEDRILKALARLETLSSDSTRSLDKDLITKIKQNHAEEMQKNNVKLIQALSSKGRLLCQICGQANREAVILPCNHARFCSPCTLSCQQEGKCKICNGKVTGFMLIDL